MMIDSSSPMISTEPMELRNQALGAWGNESQRPVGSYVRERKIGKGR